MTTKYRVLISSALATGLAATAMTFTALPASAADAGSLGTNGTKEFDLSDSSTGANSRLVHFGRQGDEIFVADLNGDKRDELIVRRGNEFHVSGSGGSNVTADIFTYGRAGDEVYFGDWTGNGIDTPAVRRDKTFLVRYTNTTGVADTEFIYGRSGDVVFIGNWNGEGADTIAIRRGTELHLRNSLTAGYADYIYKYGRLDDTILVGDTNGDGIDTFHVRRGNVMHINNGFDASSDYNFTYGGVNDTAFLGDWNGDGVDTVGTRRAPVTTVTPDPKPPVVVDPVAQKMVDLINASRTQYGLHTLDRMDELDVVAQAWAEELTRVRWLKHHPYVKTAVPPGSRLTVDLLVTSMKYDPTEWHRVWMNSTVHRNNILRTDYTHVGVGYAQDPYGQWWAVQVLTSY